MKSSLNIFFDKSSAFFILTDLAFAKSKFTKNEFIKNKPPSK
jgi:hypothetical protein